MTKVFKLAALLALCALALAACVDSSGPILSDSQQAFGPRLRVQFYTLRGGQAHDPERALFVWRDGRYAHAAGGMREVAAFSVHPFENGDAIIQEVSVKRPHITEYALLHKIADGVYRVLAIDESDADAADARGLLRQGRSEGPVLLPHHDARAAHRLRARDRRAPQTGRRPGDPAAARAVAARTPSPQALKPRALTRAARLHSPGVDGVGIFRTAAM